MKNSFKWRKDELEDILSQFHVMHTNLSVYVEKTQGHIDRKNEQINKLKDELWKHGEAQNRATLVKANIERLMGLSD